MISLVEVAERARSGKRMREKDWNLGLFRKMSGLVERYGLEYSGPERFFDVDDEYVDNAFEASVAFLSEAGVYCVSSGRVINLSEEEVREAVREAPREVAVGQGKDSRIIRKRETGGEPVNVISGGHSPWSEELIPLPLVVRGLAKNPRVDIIEGFNYARVDGREVHGTPMAAYAAIRELERMREGVRRAGRPGMAITYYPILTKASTMIAPMNPHYGLRETDGILLSILPDIKVEEDYLAASMVYEEYGSYRVNGGAFATVGGFCGGVEGAILEAIVKAIAAWIIYRDTIQYEGGVNTGVQTSWQAGKPGEAPTPTIWPVYVVHSALRRNTNIIRFRGIIYTRTEKLCSEDSLLEVAVPVMILTKALSSNLTCLHTLPPPLVDWCIEVSDAMVKMDIKRKDFSELIQQIARERLGGRVSERWLDRRMLIYDKPRAFYEPIHECYDFVKQKTSESFEENRLRVKNYLTDLGIEFT